MKVQRLFLRNVRNIKSLDLDFRDPVTGKPMSRIVLAGANGSGKTTILECVFGLIRSLGSTTLDTPYLEQGTGSARLILQPAETSKGQWVILFNMAPTVEERQGSYLAWEYFRDDRRFEREAYGDIHELFSGDPDLGDQFFAGTSLLYLPDNRRPLSTMSGPITPEEEDPWAYRYTPTDQWKGSVESYLVWQNYLDLEDRDKGIQANRFQRITNIINQILDSKRISSVERGRVVVDISGQKKHGLDDLSSGEQQILLLLVEIIRRVKPGSIILIDEPEISLHSTWQRGLMAALDKIIEQYDAQVILATHSLEIATSVLPYQVKSLNDLGLPLGKWEPEKEILPS
ncbi:MAG TPA: AAA family ATPase [Anaerolineales bacterium]|nr:AAA family ATPase [Anaerolineales bacterium]